MSESWHLPCIFKYQTNPEEHLFVVFLQLMSREEWEQVITNLEEVDADRVSEFDVPAPKLRRLQPKPWIRDYWPSSNVILKIAKHANSTEGHGNVAYRSLVFVDSGWEAGNVVAARWESDGDVLRFNAVRVPMNLANAVLTACDLNEGFTLSQALGEDIYEEAKVDFYEEQPPEAVARSAQTILFKWPDSLPKDLRMPKDRPYIISLRELSDVQIESLQDEMVGEPDVQDSSSRRMEIYKWKGCTPSRAAIYHIFKQIQDNSPDSDGNIHIFLIDNVLEGPNGKPQLLTAMDYRPEHENVVKIAPILTKDAVPLWRKSAAGEDSEVILDEYADMWRREVLCDLRYGPVDFSKVDAMPVFLLKPFTADEERRIRTAFSTLDDCENGEDWGNDYCYFGYIWPDSKSERSIHDLRDLFESCDPYSPAYDLRSPGPYHFSNYPHHFVAVDERCLDPDNPKVLMASTLDFHGEDVSDALGWIYGIVDARTAHITYVNFDIANVGPYECLEDCKNLWLSDLTEYQENEWT